MPVLAILALGAPLSLLEHFGAILSEATATLDIKILVTAGDVGVLAILLIVLGRFGIVGIASAFALSELAMHIAYLFVMRRLLALRVGSCGEPMRWVWLPAPSPRWRCLACTSASRTWAGQLRPCWPCSWLQGRSVCLARLWGRVTVWFGEKSAGG